MGDIEAPAQGIGQGMHCTDSGIAEGHAGHQAGGGHVFPGLQVGRVGVGLGQRPDDQADRAQGQGVGDRRTVERQVGLHRMHQRVDATGGGDAARAGQGHHRAHQRYVRQQVIADDALFQLGHLVREDRHVGHLRTGARSGRNGNQRRPLALHLIHPEQLFQRAFMAGERGHRLGDINGAAAAQADQAIVATGPVSLGAGLDYGDFRLRLDLVEDPVSAPAQVGQGQIDGAGLDQDRIGDDQRVADLQARQFGVQLFDGALAGNQFVGNLERRNTHQLGLV